MLFERQLPPRRGILHHLQFSSVADVVSFLASQEALSATTSCPSMAHLSWSGTLSLSLSGVGSGTGGFVGGGVGEGVTGTSGGVGAASGTVPLPSSTAHSASQNEPSMSFWDVLTHTPCPTMDEASHHTQAAPSESLAVAQLVSSMREGLSPSMSAVHAIIDDQFMSEREAGFSSELSVTVMSVARTLPTGDDSSSAAARPMDAATRRVAMGAI
mmetsp:Transcript_5858/g.14669  ORF Transcript_5858/g.14669 Transcript_5858/m.14669 type:complete len:214 (-) Transcript_5858:150-791(-)